LKTEEGTRTSGKVRPRDKPTNPRSLGRGPVRIGKPLNLEGEVKASQPAPMVKQHLSPGTANRPSRYSLAIRRVTFKFQRGIRVMMYCGCMILALTFAVLGFCDVMHDREMVSGENMLSNGPRPLSLSPKQNRRSSILGSDDFSWPDEQFGNFCDVSSCNFSHTAQSRPRSEVPRDRRPDDQRCSPCFVKRSSFGKP
jgi:hypothetical protein